MKEKREDVDELLHQLYEVTFSLRTLLEVFPILSLSFVQEVEVSNSFLNLMTAIYEKILVVADMKHYGETTMDFLIKQTKQNILTIVYLIIKESVIDSILGVGASSPMTYYNIDTFVDIIYNRYFSQTITRRLDFAKLKIKELITPDHHYISIFENAPLGERYLEQLESTFIRFLKNMIEDSSGIFFVEYSFYFDLKAFLNNRLAQHQSSKPTPYHTAMIRDIGDTLERLENYTEVLGDQIEINRQVQHGVQQLKQIFTTFGDGFLFEALNYFDFDIEKTVDILATNDLPDYLQHIDKHLRLSTMPKPKWNSKQEEHVLNTPLTNSSSPLPWESRPFELSFGKKKETIEIGQLDERVANNIISSYALEDDDYDEEADYEGYRMKVDDNVHSDEEEVINPNHGTGSKQKKQHRYASSSTSSTTGQRSTNRRSSGKRAQKRASKKKMTSFHSS
eukprot:CAMPEP_0117418186 /NCGR_PEP_ID=MMETSP0758-20121206/25_1 /TAXON_ID=63605 /ORGANISM="Percolomonas cosmopolitus, Strain AE-1 (ATCC 50343)" /LENGTH=450 /DNA_ID=CAMNT_0005198553 /DNA_START=33 /DNA_END=1385 /DNA_ORIENTATION=-